MANTFDCIVLGAGIAGVTAARNLQESGLKVLLLEGADRIGGRMYSVRDFVTKDGQPVPVEAGAEYIHVQEDDRYHYFWEEIHRQGFVTSPLSKCGPWPLKLPRNRMFFSSWRGTRILGEVLVQPEFLPVPFLLLELNRFDPDKKADLSARDYLAKKAKGFSGKARDLLEYTLSAHTPGPLEELSIAGLSSDEIMDQLMEPKELRLELDQKSPRHLCGYDELPRRIAVEFRRLGGKLQTSPAGTTDLEVVRITRLDDGTVEVRTKGGKIFAGRSVVCTFSAGMLNPETGEGDAIFGDLLTTAKRAALEVVRMGAITKLSLEFKQRVWIDDDGSFAKHMSVLSHPRGKARTIFSSFPKEQLGPHVLTGLLMNQDHKRISGLSDAEAVAHFYGVLQKIYDRDGKWRPEKVLVGKKDRRGQFVANYLRQDWSQDPFARGGNSYLKFIPKRQRKLPVTEAREALKDPRATLPLFWAGEATAPAYHHRYQPLAVHGAHVSGVRVAEDVQAYLTELGGDARRFERYYVDKYLSRRSSKALVA